MAQAQAVQQEDPNRRIPIIAPNRVGLAEHQRNHWVATAENAEHTKDFLDPGFWSNVAKDFRQYDIVEVRVDDGTYWGEFLVMSCDRTWAKLHPLREVRLQAAPASPISNLCKVDWKGPHRKFAVIKIADGSVLHDGEQERAGAERWLDSYVRGTAGVGGAPA